jgi:hypothetical protein
MHDIKGAPSIGHNVGWLGENIVACKPCRCSGDDALNLCGKTAAVVEGCTLSGRKCGVRAYEQANGSIMRCRVEDCGQQGVKAFEHADLSFQRCVPCTPASWQLCPFYCLCNLQLPAFHLIVILTLDVVFSQP